MSKTASAKNVKRSASTGQFVVRRSAAQELKVVKGVAAELKKDPAKVKAMAVSAGIFNSKGMLTKAFGGKA
ncbi:MAG: hypothetical protein K8F53_14640 [Rhodocyclaceae bacterium]|nr:hypothetical protein [Rhodocyclaceae bacterium]